MLQKFYLKPENLLVYNVLKTTKILKIYTKIFELTIIYNFYSIKISTTKILKFWYKIHKKKFKILVI